MENFNRFMNEVKRLNVIVVEYRYLDGAGWIPTKEHPNLPNNLKKSYWWKLAPCNENELEEIQSNAINEVMLLTKEQLTNCLRRLRNIKFYSNFYDFIKEFAPKFYEGKHNGLDISDFKLKLDGCFTVALPKKGNFDIHFLDDLQNEIFFKDGLLDGLKYQIEQLLPEQLQQGASLGGILGYNPSQFNNYTFGLYNYIIDNYEKSGNVKYINVWYFLKRDCDKTSHPDLMFNFTQKKYKEFVQENHGIKITKFQKADFDYDDTQKGVLKELANLYKPS